jgi:hypothetical protein
VVSEFVARMARVEIEENGDWVLTVQGGDVHEVLWNSRELSGDVFPGHSMGHRLINHGFMPDRRDTRWYASGWRPVGKDAWVIPCYREDS